jgi:hypothetical protein
VQTGITDFAEKKTAAQTRPVSAKRPHGNSVGEGWRQLHGDYRQLGFSFEWHDFVAKQPMNWGAKLSSEQR